MCVGRVHTVQVSSPNSRLISWNISSISLIHSLYFQVLELCDTWAKEQINLSYTSIPILCHFEGNLVYLAIPTLFHLIFSSVDKHHDIAITAYTTTLIDV